jgi:hypothetical protein
MLKGTDQLAEFQRQWVEQQQQLLNNWLASLQSGGRGTAQNNWRTALDIIEQQINSALDAQKRSLVALIESAERVAGMPEPMAQGLHQLEEGIDRWNDVQRQLWQVWFDTLRATSAPVPQTPGEMMFRNWQEMADRARSIQEQWLSTWTGALTSAGVTSGEKPGKAPAAKPPSKGTGTDED